MGRLRDLWLENADVAELSHRKRERTDLASGFFGRSSGRPAEIHRRPRGALKLSLFLRSRWFQPPLGGLKMAALMYDAVNAMGPLREPASSLLPSGQGLICS